MGKVTLRNAIENRDAYVIGVIADKRRNSGSTHWATWEFLNGISPITKAAFDEVMQEYENDHA